MATTSKYSKQPIRKSGKPVVSKVVKDYGNDPLFVKKADESQKFLEKHGFPALRGKK